MKNLAKYFAMAAGFVVLLATAGLLTSRPALAQLVQLLTDIDNPGRIPYQVTLENQPCNIELVNGQFVFHCFFIAPAVPTGMRVVIQHVSGNFTYANFGATFTNVELLASGTPIGWLPASFVGIPHGGIEYQINQSTVAYFDAGQVPEIELTSDRLIRPSQFTLSGHILDCSVAACAAIAPTLP